MAIPSYAKLMVPVLKNSSAAINADDLVEAIGNQLGIPGNERQLALPSGEFILRNRVRWSVFYLRRAGLMETVSRGIFKITLAGNNLLEEGIVELDYNQLMSIPKFAEWKEGTGYSTEPTAVNDASQAQTPDEQIRAVAKELREGVKADLKDRILAQSPAFLERLVLKLLTKMGFGGDENFAHHIGGPGDGGFDGVINEDALGLDVLYIQAKRYDPLSTVGRPDLQKFVGSLAGKAATKGVFVTTSKFSKDALAYLNSVAHRVVTIDGDRLVELMVKHRVGVRTRESIEIYRIDEDLFADSDL